MNIVKKGFRILKASMLGSTEMIEDETVKWKDIKDNPANKDYFIKFEQPFTDSIYKQLVLVGQWSKYSHTVLRGWSTYTEQELTTYILENTSLNEIEFKVSKVLVTGARIQL
jgi:hypothetical protein